LSTTLTCPQRLSTTFCPQHLPVHNVCPQHSVHNTYLSTTFVHNILSTTLTCPQRLSTTFCPQHLPVHNVCPQHLSTTLCPESDIYVYNAASCPQQNEVCPQHFLIYAELPLGLGELLWRAFDSGSPHIESRIRRTVLGQRGRLAPAGGKLVGFS
jgi:hypothetical protein